MATVIINKKMKEVTSAIHTIKISLGSQNVQHIHFALTVKEECGPLAPYVVHFDTEGVLSTSNVFETLLQPCTGNVYVGEVNELTALECSILKVRVTANKDDCQREVNIKFISNFFTVQKVEMRMKMLNYGSGCSSTTRILNLESQSETVDHESADDDIGIIITVLAVLASPLVVAALAFIPTFLSFAGRSLIRLTGLQGK